MAATEIDNDYIIEVDRLNFGYVPGETVLNNVSFRIRRGEAVAILGENGSGKSSLFLCLLGLVGKIRGKIRVCGIHLTPKNAPEIRKKTALMFQDSNDQLFLPLVTDELAFGPYNLGVRGNKLRNLVKVTAKKLGLDEYLVRKTFKLSHGEKKRIAFATNFIMNPEIYLLDEPFAGLDPANKNLIIEKLRELHNSGKTILMVSHDIASIPSFFGRTLVFHKGKMIFDGSLRDLYMNPEIMTKANLDIPKFLKLFYLLRDMDIIADNRIPVTVEEAAFFIKESILYGGVHPEARDEEQSITAGRFF